MKKEEKHPVPPDGPEPPKTKLTGEGESEPPSTRPPTTAAPEEGGDGR